MLRQRNAKYEDGNMTYYITDMDMVDVFPIAERLIKGEWVTCYPGSCTSQLRYDVERTSSFISVTAKVAAEQLLTGIKRDTPTLNLKEIHGNNVATRCDCMRDLSGAYPDIGAYINGDPECMINFEAVTEPRFIRLAVANGASASITTDQLNEIGTRIASLIKSLEDKGYQVALDLVNTASDNLSTPNHVAVTRVIVKEYHDVMDGDLIDYIFSTQGFRWMTFAVSDYYQLLDSSGPYRSDTYHPAASENGDPLEMITSRGYPIAITDKQLLGKMFDTIYDLVLPSISSNITKHSLSLEGVNALIDTFIDNN